MKQELSESAVQKQGKSRVGSLGRYKKRTKDEESFKTFMSQRHLYILVLEWRTARKKRDLVSRVCSTRLWR